MRKIRIDGINEQTKKKNLLCWILNDTFGRLEFFVVYVCSVVGEIAIAIAIVVSTFYKMKPWKKAVINILNLDWRYNKYFRKINSSGAKGKQST